jgi:uncharacterized protein
VTEMLIIDADSHVSEPRDIWIDRMPKKWGDLIPQVRDDNGEEAWFVGGKRMASVVASSSMRLNHETGARYRDMPSDVSVYAAGNGYADLHPSSYDAKARLGAMDELGLYAAVLYPNLNLVINDLHEQYGDPAYKLDVIRAYNDWMIDWSSADPSRLIPLALVPYFDPEVAATEIYRCKEAGHRGLVTTGRPHWHGHPPLSDKSWDPMWQAAQDTGLSINFHVGANENFLSQYVNAERIEAETPRGMVARATTDILLDNASTLSDLLFSGVCARFPELKFVLVETGMGWVNFCLEACDYHFKRYGVAEARPDFKELPSFYFHRQVYTTYWFEKMRPFHLETLGVDNLMFESDYPHPTSLDPSDIKWAMDEGLAGLTQLDKEKIMWRNAAKVYGLEVPASR